MKKTTFLTFLFISALCFGQEYSTRVLRAPVNQVPAQTQNTASTAANAEIQREIEASNLQASESAQRTQIDINAILQKVNNPANQTKPETQGLTYAEYVAYSQYLRSQNRDVQADIIPSAGATETFPVVTGDFFYDPTDGVNGGPGGDCTTTSSGDPGDYPNCGCVTTTTLTGTDLTVEFLSFNVFGNFDFLNIYDGTDTSGTQIYDSNLDANTDTLAGMIAANGSAQFTSTTGALTFEFSATAVVNSCGWEVEVISAGGGGGGGNNNCNIASDCELMDTSEDPTTLPEQFFRPIGSGPVITTNGPNTYELYGPFTVDTAGNYTFTNTYTTAGYDGYIFLYETCFDPLDQLTNLLAGNDDFNGVGGSQIADFPLVTGTEYYIVTSGFNSADFGDYTLDITGAGTVTCGAAPMPDNDMCMDATPVACGETVLGDTSDNTDTGGANASNDEWFQFTGDGSPQLVTVSLCDGGTGFDSVISVYDACGGTQVVLNDDSCGLQSEATFTSDGTTTYYIAVEGFGTNAGAFSLAVSCNDFAENDLCENAIEVDCGASVTGSTDNATIDTDVAGAMCGTTITSPGVWYAFTDSSGLAGNITATLCNGTDFDSKISVFSGDCNALVCIDGNDDDCGLQSTVEFGSDGMSTYYILVHGFGGSTGDFTLDISCVPTPPSNDLIANSIDVDELGCPFTDSDVAFPAATTEAGNPTGCNIDGANGVWYNITPEGDGTISVSLSNPAGASFVNFFTADDENATEDDLTLVAQFDNQCLPSTSTTINVVAGQAYYVFVANTGGVSDVVFDCNLLGTTANEIEGFNFYPNPANERLTIEASQNIEFVELFNMLGQRLLQQQVNATTTQLDVSGLSTGTYLMKATSNGVTSTYKLIKR